MHLSPENLPHAEKASTSPTQSTSADPEQEADSNMTGDGDLEASLLNFNIPITTTYLNHIRKKKMHQLDNDQDNDQLSGEGAFEVDALFAIQMLYFLLF